MKFTGRTSSFHSETRYAGIMTTDGASFAISLPPAAAPETPLVFASPHSGEPYPDDMGAVAGLARASLKSAEDALVGALVREGPAHGAPLIEGRIGRAYLDLNRDPGELDPDLIVDADGPVGAKTRAGYGVIPRLSGDVRPRMVAALEQCKQHFKVGCITNNVQTGHGAGMSGTSDKAAQVAGVMALFDAVLESSKAGVRKPDPRIYEMMCELLEVEASRCVYLDDLGVNCKPAAMLGMRAIKVGGVDQALAELSAATGLIFE